MQVEARVLSITGRMDPVLHYLVESAEIEWAFKRKRRNHN